MTTFNILSPEVCGKKIARIAKVGKALQDEIHVVAVSTLDHIREHGDYTLAIRLLNAMPNGQRVNALGFWYGVFSGGAAKFSYDSQNKTWKCKYDGTLVDKIDVAKAMETTFADLVPEKSYSTFTMDGLIEFFKRKANEDGKNPDGSAKVAPEVRELAASLYAKMKPGKLSLASLDGLIVESEVA